LLSFKHVTDFSATEAYLISSYSGIYCSCSCNYCWH